MRTRETRPGRIGRVSGRWTEDDLPMLRLAWAVTGLPATLVALSEAEAAVARPDVDLDVRSLTA